MCGGGGGGHNFGKNEYLFDCTENCYRTFDNGEFNGIISLIRKLNPSKANGSDGISGQMLLLCDDSAIYPDIWKLGNVTNI